MAKSALNSQLRCCQQQNSEACLSCPKENSVCCTMFRAGGESHLFSGIAGPRMRSRLCLKGKPPRPWLVFSLHFIFFRQLAACWVANCNLQISWKTSTTSPLKQEKMAWRFLQALHFL